MYTDSNILTNVDLQGLLNRKQPTLRRHSLSTPVNYRMSGTNNTETEVLKHFFNICTGVL